MDAPKVAAGALFLAASSVSLMETGLFTTRTPLVLGALASLCVAIGSLVIGSGGKAA